MEFFSQSYDFIPDMEYARELARPWKLVTFGLGMAWLFFGALTYEIADWDVGVSLVMGVLTYLFAPWSVYILGSAFRSRPRFWWFHALVALAIAVLVVDISYLLYHGIAGNPVYRDANFRASMPLYFLAGTILLYRGTVRSFLCGIRAALTACTTDAPITADIDAQDRLLRYGTCEYAYNANGDLEARLDTATNEATSYRYDEFGNLLTVELPNGDTLDYVIDGLNRRIGKKRNGTVERTWLYANQLEPVAEFDGDGNLIARYAYGEKAHVPTLMVKDGKTYRIVSDHLGSVRQVIDALSGETMQAMDYDAWGNVLQDTDPGFQPFGYAGGLYDRDTGFARFGARDYDPITGRWMAKDPIGFNGAQENLYVYVRNSPINLIDPSGLAPLGVCLGREMVRQYGPEDAFNRLARIRDAEWQASDAPVNQALRNAEHYVFNRLVIHEQPNMYFLMVPAAMVYSPYKNVLNALGGDRYVRTPGTADEMLAGAMGADEEYNGLLPQEESCGCSF